MDWLAFDPQRAFMGGILIGLAAVMLMYRIGRIAGVSGILANGIWSRGAREAWTERGWRLAFLAGLALGAYAMAQSLGGFTPRFGGGWMTLVLGGLLVGYGTRLGSGCTSGHGICGLARFSGRSLAATLVFMAAGIVTVFVLRHLVGG